MEYIDSQSILRAKNSYDDIKAGFDLIYNILSSEKLNPSIEDVKRVYSNREHIRKMFEAMKSEDIENSAPIDRDIIKKQIDNRVNELVPKLPTRIYDNAILTGDWVIKGDEFVIPKFETYITARFTTKLNKEQIKAVKLLDDMVYHVNKVDAYFERKGALSGAVYKTTPCVGLTGKVDLWKIIRNVK